MKRYLLFVIFCTVFLTSWGEQITREQAMQRAQQFLQVKGYSKSLADAESPVSKARAKGQQMSEYYYVFNIGNQEGYVVVSGDDNTPEILGYSLRGSFDCDNLPPAKAALLENYAAQIAYLQNNSLSASVRKRNHPYVSDLVSSQWGQDEPYNKYCPKYLTKTCPTGCVATAMAQVMYTL
ncbi:MAG: C10 family peptidase, partial [Prevotella sp.]|nr:C10 family peptidase [Prevotella sp.]